MAELQNIQDEPDSDFDFQIEPAEVIETDSDWFETGINSAIGVIDRVSKIPLAFTETGQNLTDQFTEAGQKLQGAKSRIAGEGGARARENLKRGNINNFFLRVSDWLQRGNNIWYALGGAVLLIFLIRKA